MHKRILLFVLWSLMLVPTVSAQQASTEETDTNWLPMVVVIFVILMMLRLVVFGTRGKGDTPQQATQNGYDPESAQYDLMERDDRWEDEGYWDDEQY